MSHAQCRREEEAEISHGGFMTGQHISKSGRAIAWMLLVVFAEIPCADQEENKLMDKAKAKSRSW